MITFAPGKLATYQICILARERTALIPAIIATGLCVGTISAYHSGIGGVSSIPPRSYNLFSCSRWSNSYQDQSLERGALSLTHLRAAS